MFQLSLNLPHFPEMHVEMVSVMLALLMLDIRIAGIAVGPNVAYQLKRSHVIFHSRVYGQIMFF